MKKLLLLIFVFIFSFSLTYSAEIEEAKITSILYSWNLSNESEIEINWNNFDRCKKLLIDSNEISIISKKNNKLKFLFSEIWKYNWEINLECWEKILKKTYFFPYINKVTWIKNDNLSKYITINWGNYWYSAQVKIEWWSFKQNIYKHNTITWYIPSTITNKAIYIEVNWLKSNIVNLNIKIPKINYIYSKDNFFNKTEIFIFWKNLNYYTKSKIFFWEKEILNYKFDEKKWLISFFSDAELWKRKIKILSNGFESNAMDITITWNRPIIYSTDKRNITEEINWEKKTQELIVIIWENFHWDIKDLKLYINGSIVKAYKMKSKEIYVTDYNLNSWNNYFQIELNWNHSNIWVYYNIKNYNFPKVTWIELWSIEEGRRNILLHLYNFDIKKDKIFFNNSQINPIWCIVNICRVQISESVLKWKFTAWIWTSKNYNYKEFDISYDNLPFIDYVTIKWELWIWALVEIVWDNFNDSSISINNIFDKDKRRNIDMKVSNYKITWRIWLSYKQWVDNHISIRKYWQSANIKFSWINAVRKKIYWNPIIKEIKSSSKDLLFRKWWEIKVNWKWLKWWDSIVIWESKIPLKVKNLTYGIFTIPESIKEWKYNIFIESKLWKKSNSQEIILSSNEYKPKIIISRKKLKIIFSNF